MTTPVVNREMLRVWDLKLAHDDSTAIRRMMVIKGAIGLEKCIYSLLGAAHHVFRERCRTLQCNREVLLKRDPVLLGILTSQKGA